MKVLRKLIPLKLIPLLAFGLFVSQNSNAQCTSGCNTTISNSQSNVSVGSNKKLCVTSSGSVSGTLSLNWKSDLCNNGLISVSSLSNNRPTIDNYDSIYISGNFTISNQGTFTNYGTLYVDGDLDNIGTLINEGRVIVTGTIENSSSGNVTMTNSAGAYMEAGGDFVNKNEFTNAGTLRVKGDYDNTSSGQTELNSSGTIKVDGDFDNENELINSGSFSVEGNFTNSSSGQTSVDNTGDFSIGGNLTNLNDLQNKGNFTVDGNVTLTSSGQSKLTNDSTFVIGGDLTSANEVVNNGNLTIEGTYTNQAWNGKLEVGPNSLITVDSLINEGSINAPSQPYGQIVINKYAENTSNVGTYVDICNKTADGFNDNSGTVNGNVTTCTNNSPELDETILNIKVMLQGPHNSGNGKMDTLLRSNGVIPLNQPYNAAPWNYAGSESVNALSDISTSIVDWALIVLRSGSAASTAFDTLAVFIRNDGYLCNASGGKNIALPYSDKSSFHIIVDHRNHIGIKSSSAVSVNNKLVTYDFTTSQTKAYGKKPMYEIQTGLYGMIAGDGNDDFQVSASDKVIKWEAEKNKTGVYNVADYNLDSNVDSADVAIWKNGTGRVSRIDR